MNWINTLLLMFIGKWKLARKCVEYKHLYRIENTNRCYEVFVKDKLQQELDKFHSVHYDVTKKLSQK